MCRVGARFEGTSQRLISTQVGYRAWGAGGLPGTFTSSLWGEATEAYLKFQGADPISHPEVGRFKQ